MLKHEVMPKAGTKDGFTLVEIALALLVVAIGVVSIMALFPAGLKSNQRAIEETRVAMFAEDVLGGVKTMIEETPWQDVQTELQGQGLPGVAPDLFVDGGAIKAIGGPGKTPFTYEYSGSGVSIVESVVRYNLKIETIGANVNRYGITLRVWPNEFGQSEDGFAFYTEAYYHGRHN